MFGCIVVGTFLSILIGIRLKYPRYIYQVTAENPAVLHRSLYGMYVQHCRKPSTYTNKISGMLSNFIGFFFDCQLSSFKTHAMNEWHVQIGVDFVIRLDRTSFFYEAYDLVDLTENFRPGIRTFGKTVWVRVLKKIGILTVRSGVLNEFYLFSGIFQEYEFLVKRIRFGGSVLLSKRVWVGVWFSNSLSRHISQDKSDTFAYWKLPEIFCPANYRHRSYRDYKKGWKLWLDVFKSGRIKFQIGPLVYSGIRTTRGSLGLSGSGTYLQSTW